MIIFQGTKSAWRDKVNFVDENNVVLGYDLSQHCCEHADWFIADEITPRLLSQDEIPDLKGWVFDTSFYRHIETTDGDWNELDAGGMAVFRIVNGDDEKFIHIYNAHNGYYSHGFDFEANGETIESGYI